MGFSIPNYTDAVNNKTVGDQAEPDSVDFQILGNPANGLVYDPTNFQYNGRVQASGTIGNTVEVDPYKVLINGSYLYKSSSTTVTLDGGDTSPRFDLVVIAPGSTAPSVVKGTASSTNPEFPAVTEGYVVLAALYRAGSGVTGYVEARNIIDKRLFVNSTHAWIKPSSPLVDTTTAAVAKTGDLWLDGSASGTGQSDLWIKQEGGWVNIPVYIAPSTTSSPNTLVLRDSSGNFTASAVAWDNVTGKPTDIVTNNGATYGINITGNAGTASVAGYAGYLISSSAQFGWNGITGQWGTINGLYSAGLLSTSGGLNVSGGATFNSGNVFINSYPTTGAVANMRLFDDNRIAKVTSLRKHKEQIKPLDDGLSIINKLRPRMFKMRPQESDGLATRHTYAHQFYHGFIVDEIAEDAPELLDYGVENDQVVAQMWKTMDLIAVLTKAVQELSEKNTELTARIEALEAQ